MSGQSFPSRKFNSFLQIISPLGLPLWNYTAASPAAHPQLCSSSSLAVHRCPGSALKTPGVTHDHQDSEARRKMLLSQPQLLSQMKEQRNDSALEPGTSRTLETNNIMHAAAASKPKALFQPQPAPTEPKGKTSIAKGCQLVAEPPGSPGWGSGGGALVPAALRTLQALQRGQSQRCLEAAGKTCIVLPAEAQSQQFPVRPRSHHPAHSCSQPFGNQTLQEGSRKKKDLISVTLFFPEGSVNCDRRQACRWTWGMFHERFHIFMSIFLSQDLAILPKA